MFNRSIHRAHAEVEVADAVAVGVGDGEGEVETERDRAHLGNEHADTGADRGPDLGEGVISFDGAEVGEDDLLNGIAGGEGKLVLERAQSHHHAADRHAQGMGADGAVLEASKAAEVTSEIPLVDGYPLGGDAEVAPQCEETFAGAVWTAA